MIENEVNEAFWPNQTVDSQPLTGGLVHATYLVDDGTDKYILQSINTSVFSDPRLGAKNIEAISAHLLVDENYTLTVPLLVRTASGNLIFVGHQGKCWRCLSYVEDSHTRDVLLNKEDGFKVAQAFGMFSASLASLSPQKLSYTIPDFHNPKVRVEQFSKALSQVEVLSEETQLLVDLVINHRGIAEQMEALQWPLRIAHNDPKMSNVLFDKDENPISIIDLDTVMPGSPLHDFGDMIRSMASSLPEDDPDLENVSLRMDIYAEIRRGFLASCGTSLSALEKDHLDLGARYMIYEQAMRFLTDHLNGNVYYHVDYPMHNFVRASNQLRLLESLEEQLQKLK